MIGFLINRNSEVDFAFFSLKQNVHIGTYNNLLPSTAWHTTCNGYNNSDSRKKEIAVKTACEWSLPYVMWEPLFIALSLHICPLSIVQCRLIGTGIFYFSVSGFSRSTAAVFPAHLNRFSDTTSGNYCRKRFGGWFFRDVL